VWYLKQVQFDVERNESTYLEIENIVYLKTDWLQQLTDKLVSQSVTFGVNNFPEKNKKNIFL
jgi:hypothetical protein